MEFNVGDPVVHWSHGFGKVVGIEERALADQKALYLVVEIKDLTVWVPIDESTKLRLRPPTSQSAFKKLFKILSQPGKSLSEDRHERKLELHRKLRDGNAESLCGVIRDLTSYQKNKALNDDDKLILKRACSSLLGEWEYSFSLSVTQAEDELRKLLKQPLETSLV